MSKVGSVAISDVEFVPALMADDIYAEIDLREDDGSIERILLGAREEVRSLLEPVVEARADCDVSDILDALQSSGIADAESLRSAKGDRQIAGKLREDLRNGRPLKFILSLFPCKGCHPLRTFARTGAEIDLGEVACVVRLVRLLASINRIYRPGARLTILSNGRRYSDVFFEQQSHVDGYRENIRKLIAFLGCQDVISLDAEESLYSETFQNEADAETGKAKLEIENARGAFASMVTNIRLNINPPIAIKASEYAVIVRKLDGNYSSQLTLRQQLVLDFIETNATSSTARYIGINKALRKLDVFERAYGDCIKLTVHSKPGQIGILPVTAGSVFPHNGQAIVGSRASLDTVSVALAANLLRGSDTRLRGVSLSRQRFPFASSHHPFAILPSGSAHT
jgi:pyoverdine/dityrosine biosynthesis protein Dit1